MFKLPIPTRLTDYLGEAVVWTVIYDVHFYKVSSLYLFILHFYYLIKVRTANLIMLGY